MQIAVTNLTKTFGALRANDDLSLTFAAGQIHGVLGENGAGKSTLMKMLSGFLQRDSGTILINGQPATITGPADAIRVGIGMVHQDPLDVPAFQAIDNFYCAAPPQAMPNRRTAQRLLEDLNQRLGFSVVSDARLESLTVGQRQQLEIMRQLACGARTLILDEPTTGITVAQKVALFRALKQLATEGRTILFVSHKLDEVAELCQTVSVLRAGKLVGEQMTMPVAQERLLELMFGERLAQVADAKTQPTVAQATQPATWQLEQVTLREGRLELAGLNLRIAPGTVLGLAGLDGSGQQLLLRALAGRLRPTAGRVYLRGTDRTGVPYATFLAEHIHYLPADRMADGVVGALSLADHLALQDPMPGMVLNQRAAQQAARTAIANYEIKATPNTPILALSGGNQQRVMLALLPEQCSGILLDQPTRGLDVASAHAIWQRLLLRRSAGTAIVFASADLDELLDYSDALLVFFGGQVSRLLLRSELTEARLAELIGGVGFEAMP
jgi:simple sugar transport system ATP-binding protein